MGQQICRLHVLYFFFFTTTATAKTKNNNWARTLKTGYSTTTIRTISYCLKLYVLMCVYIYIYIACMCVYMCRILYNMSPKVCKCWVSLPTTITTTVTVTEVTVTINNKHCLCFYVPSAYTHTYVQRFICCARSFNTLSLSLSLSLSRSLSAYSFGFSGIL